MPFNRFRVHEISNRRKLYLFGESQALSYNLGFARVSDVGFKADSQGFVPAPWPICSGGSTVVLFDANPTDT